MDDRVEVRAGDVLLFRGGGFVSWAIRAFDGTDVNHAAIALDSTTLGEAGGRGLQRTLIETATKSNRYMRVRRHSDPDPGPVLTVASTYLDEGRPYAYQQIVLLALLASTRRLRLTGIARRMLRSVLDHGAAALNAFVDRGGARSMICSEFVYRVYAEAVADPADRYRLLIPVGDTAFDAEATSLAEWALVQPDDVLESAAAEPVSFGAPSAGDPALADERAELELAPILAAWAVESGRAGGEDMPPLPPPSFSPDVGAGPTDEELVGSLVGFGAALADATSDGPPAFGLSAATVGPAAARGLITGLLRPAIEANFVTPGDLLASPTLIDVGTVRRG
jgi:hypothetical protein